MSDGNENPTRITITAAWMSGTYDHDRWAAISARNGWLAAYDEARKP